jgi:guanidinopropionase
MAGSAPLRPPYMRLFGRSIPRFADVRNRPILPGMPEKYPEPLSGMVVPRFGEVASFMRLPVERDPKKLDIALCGVPWDGGTTNRPGARHGPRAIRDASTLMRRVHHVSLTAPYELCRVGDCGDTPVNPIDLTDSLKRIEAFYARLHKAGAVPLSAGGDHLVTLPILRAIARKRPVGLIHFDAHSDTSDSYFGGEKYTHGTPFRRAVEEGLLDPKRVVQIGIRGSLYSRDDNDWARKQGMRVITIEDYFDLGVEKVIAEARRVVGTGPTYVSFDVDGLDPAFAPGTGTPEIGGYTPHEAQRMLRGLRGLDLVGGDVVEVSPPFDMSGNTALVGVTMMWEILCLLSEAVAKRKGRL